MYISALFCGQITGIITDMQPVCDVALWKRIARFPVFLDRKEFPPIIYRYTTFPGRIM
jgi:hypothetical protein